MNKIILGIPLLTQIYSFKVTTEGIYPSKFNKICFEFSISLIDKDVNIILKN